jgi:hypothetical protein
MFILVGENDLDFKKVAIFILHVLVVPALALPAAAWWGRWGGWGWW